jgi:Zn-dependent oligopeptidase
MGDKAADAGYTFTVGPELEYYYFKSAQEPEVLDSGGYFDLTGLDYASDLRRDTVLALGGSESAYEVFQRFRGRAPTIDALLRQQGLKR